MTARPYFGSGSRIVWPPASVPPASRTLRAAPSKIAASTSRGRSSGNAAIDRANSTRPPIAKTSLSAFAAAISPNVRGVVDERRKEVERADDREVVADPVRGRVVGRVEAGDQLARLRAPRPAPRPLSASASRSAPSFAAQPPQSVSSVRRIGRQRRRACVMAG